MTTFKISLAAARVNANMTQTMVAKALGVSTQTIINWETGKTQPKIEQCERISELYGIPSQNIIFVPKETNLICMKGEGNE